MRVPDSEVCPHPEEDRTNWGEGNHGCGRCGATPRDLAWQSFMKRANQLRTV